MPSELVVGCGCVNASSDQGSVVEFLSSYHPGIDDLHIPK